MFPRRPIDAPPIFTPPATHTSQSYGSPRYEAGSLNEIMSSDVETLRLLSWHIGFIWFGQLSPNYFNLCL